MDQTLTCIIEGLDTGYPVYVIWTDPEGDQISIQDIGNYELSQERVVNYNGSQTSELTIRKSKLESFAGSPSFSFKFGCSAESSQYGGSPLSNSISVHAEVLNLGPSFLN